MRLRHSEKNALVPVFTLEIKKGPGVGGGGAEKDHSPSVRQCYYWESPGLRQEGATQVGSN